MTYLVYDLSYVRLILCMTYLRYDLSCIGLVFYMTCLRYVEGEGGGGGGSEEKEKEEWSCPRKTRTPHLGCGEQSTNLRECLCALALARVRS